MNEKQFVIWLHGFLEISEAKTLDERQLQIIKDHLNEFFVKVTPEQEQKEDNPNDSKEWFEKWQEPYIQKPYWPYKPSKFPIIPNTEPYKITCSHSTGEFQPLHLTKTYC